MSTSTDTITSLVQSEYKYGFYMDIETESARKCCKFVVEPNVGVDDR